jgi:hypothetical protein
MSKGALALFLTLIAVTNAAYTTPVTIDFANPCGKNCSKCVGYSCMLEACHGHYYSAGDRCEALNEAKGEVIENCVQYSASKNCMKCQLGWTRLASGFCGRLDDSCLTGLEADAGGPTQCLICKDSKKTGNTNAMVDGVSGCDVDCIKENCKYCGGTGGCWMCEPGYARFETDSVWNCIKMMGNSMDNCLISANAEGTLCAECNHYIGSWMRDEITCSNKALLFFSAMPILMMMLLVGHWAM